MSLSPRRPISAGERSIPAHRNLFSGADVVGAKHVFLVVVLSGPGIFYLAVAFLFPFTNRAAWSAHRATGLQARVGSLLTGTHMLHLCVK